MQKLVLANGVENIAIVHVQSKNILLMKFGILQNIESTMQCSHGVSVLLKALWAVRKQVEVFCIHAHDMSKDPSPSL